MDALRTTLTDRDRRILRDLAKAVAERAARPEMAERMARWIRHNKLQPGRPLIMIWPEGSWRELVPAESLECEGEQAQLIERGLRQRVYACDHFADDMPVTRDFHVGKVIHETSWGLEPERVPSTEARGAWKFKPVIHSHDDLKKLQFPEVEHDETATKETLALCEDLFGDILDVQLVGRQHFTFHLMQQYANLRGLGEAMMDMAAEPQMLHDATAFFVEGHKRRIRQHEEQNLLSLNNRSPKVSSGGTGYTDELPPPDFDPTHVRPKDMWSSAESQELAQVSPAMHDEFALQYEAALLEPFGLNGYGCCEDLTDKLDLVIERLPHLRRISIAPWADVAKCAERLRDDYILSWKPNPSMLVGEFDQQAIRDHIRDALEAGRGCIMEIVLKDTHTCESRPERFDIWTRIARELVHEL